MEAYSNCGRMRVLYAVYFSSCLCGLIFLFRKPNDWFAQKGVGGLNGLN